MKTSFQFVDLIYQVLQGSSLLKTSINGKIYKHKRPDGSKSQDVVINSLATNNEQLQLGVINVNFHCPNLEINIDSQPAVSMPDHVKLFNVSNILIDLLKDCWTDEFHCTVQSQNSFEEEELRETFSNIRVNVYSINI